jgi:hypothetical protein
VARLASGKPGVGLSRWWGSRGWRYGEIAGSEGRRIDGGGGASSPGHLRGWWRGTKRGDDDRARGSLRAKGHTSSAACAAGSLSCGLMR